MSDLLKINVNGHTEKKNGLTYLSWAWAWSEVLKIDTTATWEPHHFGASDEAIRYVSTLEDGTALVGVNVTIHGIRRGCLLPVMDHKNKAIPKPNAFDVNKAQMRCLAKAIAMHGLGLYIYAGEDMPEQDHDGSESDNEGADPDVIPDAAVAASKQGTKGYEAYWKGLAPAERRTLLPHHASLKAQAAQVTQEAA
jgi:hypothetical protein